jgi:hypothetical protein
VKPLWAQEPSDAEPLTPEILRAAAMKIRDQPPPAPHGSSGNPHLVSPAAFDRGYGTCAECGLLVSTASLN